MGGVGRGGAGEGQGMGGRRGRGRVGQTMGVKTTKLKNFSSNVHLLKEFCKLSNRVSFLLGCTLESHLLDGVLQELSHLELHSQLILLSGILDKRWVE